MRFPLLREWVCVEGREGIFIVVEIDRAKGSAGVMTADADSVVLSVPLASVLPLGKARGQYTPTR